MTRHLATLLLLAIPASAQTPPSEWINGQHPNTPFRQVRAAVYDYQHKPPPPITRDEQLLIDTLALIELAREALNPAYSQAKRTVYARQFLELTDPVDYPTYLGGEP